MAEVKQKKCEECRKIMTRKRSANGKLDKKFKTRRFCSCKCAAISREKIKKTRKRSLKNEGTVENDTRYLCDIVCPKCGKLVEGNLRAGHRCFKECLRSLDRKLALMSYAERIKSYNLYV